MEKETTDLSGGQNPVRPHSVSSDYSDYRQAAAIRMEIPQTTLLP